MTIQEAIKVLGQLPYQGEGCLDGKTFAALKLGIQALEAVTLWNHKQLPQYQIHLPGETKK